MPKKRKAAKAAPRKAASKPNAKAASKARTETTAASTRRKPASRAGDPTAPQPVPDTIFDIVHPGAAAAFDPSFPDAPEGWTQAQAQALATKAGLTLTEDHWEVIRVLQGCYKDEVSPRLRLLHDALAARFATKGGMKHLFGILPGGPIAQGCALAGLKPPHGAKDLSFGSVA